MKPVQFAVTVAGVFALLAAGYAFTFALVWSQPTEPEDALRDVVAVKIQLAAEAPSPRWLIVGGSSAWFGFDSGLLEKAIDQRVVNLGAHADLPLWFQLSQAEKVARPGDTVLLAAELVHFWRDRPTDYGAIKLGVIAPEAFSAASWWRKWELLAAVPCSHVVGRVLVKLTGRHFPPKPISELMQDLRARWTGEYTGEVPGYYNYLELDPHGDFTRTRGPSGHRLETYGLTESHAVAREVWSDVAASAARLRSRGVACRFTWQPFEKQRLIDYDAAIVRENLREIRARLASCGWEEVGPPSDSMFPTEYFYDTAYHLTSEGARLRTLRLIARLKDR
jgi:hypothetical protein